MKNGGENAIMQAINFNKSDGLLIIDVQKDFCAGGALPVNEGDRVVSVINEWVEAAMEQKIPIYASRDWHPVGHVSFRSKGGQWPPHCIQDTPGAAFHENLMLTDETVVVTKGVRFDKDQNSAFDETGLGDYMKGNGLDRLFVCGLALDVCVFSTVMDAIEQGFSVHLILEGTRPVDYEEGLIAVKNMEKAGVTMLGEYTAPKTPAPDTEKTAAEEMELSVCTKAPEWAEHQRLNDDDEPCDDGRAGN